MNIAQGFRKLALRAFGLADLDRAMEMIISGAPTASGLNVSEKSAMTLPAVWACHDLIAKAGAMLPGHVFRRLDGGARDRERADAHYLYPIVHDLANPRLPAQEWRRLTLHHLLGWGNSYSWIEWTVSGRPKWLWPIPPDKVRVKRKTLTDPIDYEILGIDGQYHPFPEMDILHIRGLGYDGTVGYSPLSMMRETIGLGLAQQQSAAALHKNGFTSRLLLEHPGTLTPLQMDELKKSFAEANTGLRNAHKAIVLQAGMKATPFSINPNDAEVLDQGKLTNADIYRIHGVPPHMVGDTEKATSWGTGIEQQTIGFVAFTLLPLMDLIETWLAIKLLPDDQKTYFVEYDAKGLLRGDTTARGAWYRTMIEAGAYSPNRVLISENEDPYEGGDVYRRPLNTAFVDSTGKVIAFTPPGKATGDPNNGQAQVA